MFMDMAEIGSGSRSGVFSSNTWKERRAWRFGVPAFKSTIHTQKKRRSRSGRILADLFQIENYPSSLIIIDLRYSVTPRISLNSIVLLSNATDGGINGIVVFVFSS